MNKPLLRINRKRFVEWYYDKDTAKDVADNVIQSLIVDGNYEISMEDIWQHLGYINKDLIINQEDINKDDIDNHDEIFEPSQNYDVMFVRGEK